MHEWQGEIVGGLDNPPGFAGPDDEHPPTSKQTREDMGNIWSDAESDAWEQRDQLTSLPALQLASHVHDRKCVTHRREMDASEGGTTETSRRGSDNNGGDCLQNERVQEWGEQPVSAR